MKRIWENDFKSEPVVAGLSESVILNDFYGAWSLPTGTF